MLAFSLSSALAVAADAGEVTYALTIANGRVPDNMRLIRVKQNDPSGGHAHGDVLVTIEVYP